MPRVKRTRRKTPIVLPETTRTSSSTPQSSRTVIRRFHVLLKKRSQILNTPTGDANTAEALASVQHQISDLGDLKCYQRMSAVGQSGDRGGGSEKVLIRWLKELKVNSLSLKEIKVRLLEVGALKPDNYKSCSAWIECTPIDLRSRHPSIREQDFLLMSEEHRSAWDVISLSLVLNFVPEPNDRGRMLQLAHRMLAPGGYLFLALPLPCLLNSRYLTFEHFKGLMNHLHFTEIYEKWRQGGKMVYWLYRKEDLAPSGHHLFHKKTVLRQGQRNNFSILLKEPDGAPSVEVGQASL